MREAVRSPAFLRVTEVTNAWGSGSPGAGGCPVAAVTGSRRTEETVPSSRDSPPNEVGAAANPGVTIDGITRLRREESGRECLAARRQPLIVVKRSTCATSRRASLEQIRGADYPPPREPGKELGMKSPSTKLLLAAAALVLFATVTTIAGATSSQQPGVHNGVITACVEPPTKGNRATSGDLNFLVCLKGARKISWNIRGPRGPAGPAGRRAPKGQQVHRAPKGRPVRAEEVKGRKVPQAQAGPPGPPGPPGPAAFDRVRRRLHRSE